MATAPAVAAVRTTVLTPGPLTVSVPAAGTAKRIRPFPVWRSRDTLTSRSGPTSGSPESIDGLAEPSGVLAVTVVGVGGVIGTTGSGTGAVTVNASAAQAETEGALIASPLYSTIQW